VPRRFLSIRVPDLNTLGNIAVNGAIATGCDLKAALPTGRAAWRMAGFCIGYKSSTTGPVIAQRTG
jgi:hypothetical protein